MLAAVRHDVHDLRLEQVADPIAGAGEVVIAIAHNGLCGADLKLFEMGLRAVDQPHPLTGFCGPQILGHELSGVIAEVGEGVTTLALAIAYACSPTITAACVRRAKPASPTSVRSSRSTE